MPTKTQSNGTAAIVDTGAELMKSYKTTIADYLAAATGGQKMKATKEINRWALKISLMDETPDGFEWFVPAPKGKVYMTTLEELNTRIQKLETLLTTAPDHALKTIETELENRRKERDARTPAES